jgi:hypothetical protein
MPEFDLLMAAEQLAAEFRARGMDSHLALLRRFYAELRHRRQARARVREKGWDEGMVIGWLGLLRVPPFEHVYPLLPRDARCPRCSAEGTRAAPATFTKSVWPGGSLNECRQCQALWLTDEASDRLPTPG